MNRKRLLITLLLLSASPLLAGENFPPLWEVDYKIEGPGANFCRSVLSAANPKGQIIGADYTSEFTYAVRVHGKLVLRDWTIAVDGRYIERDASGAFVFVHPLQGAQGAFELVGRSPMGLVEACKISVDYRARYMALPTKEMLSSGTSGEFFFGPHFAKTSWTAPGANLDQVQLGMRFGFNDYRRSDYLAYSFEGQGTLMALSKTPDTASMNTYQLAARIGRRITPPDRRLVIVLLAGAQYFTSTGNIEHFSNRLGLTFYPTLDYRDRSGRVFSVYVKYVPYLDGLRLFGSDNSEIGAGIGYDGIWRKLKPDETWVRLGLRLDFTAAKIRTQSSASGAYSSFLTSFVFSW